MYTYIFTGATIVGIMSFIKYKFMTRMNAIEVNAVRVPYIQADSPRRTVYATLINTKNGKKLARPYRVL